MAFSSQRLKVLKAMSSTRQYFSKKADVLSISPTSECSDEGLKTFLRNVLNLGAIPTSSLFTAMGFFYMPMVLSELRALPRSKIVVNPNHGIFHFFHVPLSKLQDRLWQKKHVSINVKCKGCRAVVLSTLLYGAETWTIYRYQI